MKPKSLKILGIKYTLEYCGSPSDVDIFKRESLWGQIDYWTRTIRVYDNGIIPIEEIWDTIIHEALHGIINALRLKGKIEDHKESEEIVSLLALGLREFLFENNLLKFEKEKT